MPWSAGEAEVERLLDQGSIARVQGAQADGESWLERARRGLDAARIVAEAAPDSSIILAYDAARQASSPCWPSRASGRPPQAATTLSKKRSALSLAPACGLSADCAVGETSLSILYPTESADADEAAEALTTADEIIDAVARLLPNLGFF